MKGVKHAFTAGLICSFNRKNSSFKRYFQQRILKVYLKHHYHIWWNAYSFLENSSHIVDLPTDFAPCTKIAVLPFDSSFHSRSLEYIFLFNNMAVSDYTHLYFTYKIRLYAENGSINPAKKVSDLFCFIS